MMRRNGSLYLSRGRVKREAGATLVEFAAVVSILLVVMLGVVDFSRALYTYHFLSNMARTATRWAAVNGYTCADDTSTTDTGGSCNGTDGMNDGPASASDIVAYVNDHAPDGINTSKLTVTATWPVLSDSPTICSTAVTGYAESPYPNYPGCTVEVNLSYQFNFLYPFIPTSTITLSSTSEMVISH
jgi:Flp pilus assembly protein TadG